MANINIYSSQVQQLLSDRNGPVGKLLLEIGNRVRDDARTRVGVSEAGNSAGGHLRDALVSRLEPGPICYVGTFEPGTGYALYHHEGTAPHEIHARNAKALVFHWKAVNAVAIVPSGGASFTGYFAGGARFMIGKGFVNHPGTQPNRYLTDALAAIRIS